MDLRPPSEKYHPGKIACDHPGHDEYAPANPEREVYVGSYLVAHHPDVNLGDERFKRSNCSIQLVHDYSRPEMADSE